jgi:hypothetical protein
MGEDRTGEARRHQPGKSEWRQTAETFGRRGEPERHLCVLFLHPSFGIPLAVLPPIPDSRVRRTVADSDCGRG